MSLKLLTTRFALFATAAAVSLLVGSARAQPVSGLYIGVGGGGNFMPDESSSFTERIGGSRTTSTQVTSFSPLTTRLVTTSYPPSTFGGRGSFSLDPGGVAVASVGYGFGNGLRVEIEGDYRINSFPQNFSGSEQKYGGMANVLYDLPFGVLGVTPYAGLGAGYMWVDRGRNGIRTNSFAYQAILGGSLPIAFVPGLSATLEYRFMGLAGAAHRFVEPGYSYAYPGPFSFSYSQDPSVGKNKYSDDYNHSVMIGLRYAFNAAPAPVEASTGGHIIRDPAMRAYLIFFDWDRADLTDRARAIIANAARMSQEVRTTRIQVNGSTDTTGTARYNQGLSVRRAQNVAAELVRDGVPRGAITTQGFGFSRLLVPTGPGVREPQNRRVEIILQ